ncbi:hypothetical protein DW322_16130 [Rhodococcus rhodnii]|uniref:Lipoprotein n=1 Tax=Rhodococcus rhodnii TaxID=38312 RepID=A0A6P2CNZ8_9NOCA|nr:hypothetical protein [Rhodococcus rhodnii]TXG92778.1 hypothetical protein DW322_16130 [Rhodococcus rhodnii]
MPVSVLLAATAAVLAGCGGPPPPPAPAPAPSAETTTTPAPDAPVAGGVTQTQADALCSEMERQLQSWRTYTPSIGRGGLNILVGTWIAQNGQNPAAYLQDRGRVDTITAAACPDVREGAISALDIPDLASGIVGF